MQGDTEPALGRVLPDVGLQGGKEVCKTLLERGVGVCGVDGFHVARENGVKQLVELVDAMAVDAGPLAGEAAEGGGEEGRPEDGGEVEDGGDGGGYDRTLVGHPHGVEQGFPEEVQLLRREV